jgi:sulfide:quinone oxidoreductase
MPRSAGESIVCSMSRSVGSRACPHVVVAGGGFGAVETVLAMRALMAGRVRVTLVSPSPEFAYRPAATLQAFGPSKPLCYDLAAVARDLGADYQRARLESVASERRGVRLSSGQRLTYDALVLAVGARPLAVVSGAMTFRDQRDVPHLRRLIGGLKAGDVRRLVFAFPTGCSWPAALYELAMFSAAHASRHGVRLDVTVVSPDPEPLAMFGAAASDSVRQLLADRGVSFIGDATASAVQRDGSLSLLSGEVVEADRVIAGPQLRGPWIAGVPASRSGFLPTDGCGRVVGLPGVYAAGDATTYPVKQAGLATQQADIIARTIAAEIGAPVIERLPRRVLQARLVGGRRPLFLRAELDHRGRPRSTPVVRTKGVDAPAHAKVLARYLTPYLEFRKPPVKPVVG